MNRRSCSPSALERRVTLIGVVGSSVLTVGLLLDVATSGSGEYLGILPLIVVSVGYGFGYFSHRRVLVPLNLLILALMLVSGWSLPTEENRFAISVSFAIVAAVVAAFAQRLTKVLVGIAAVLGVVFPYMWSGSWVVALMTGGAAATVGFLIIALRSEIESGLARSKAVLQKAPVAIMEQDWSEVRSGLDRIRMSGVSNLDRYLDEHPGEVAGLMSGVTLEFANRAALDMYRAESLDQVRQRFSVRRTHSDFVNDRSAETYRRYLLAMWGAETKSDEEIHSYRLDGTELWGKVRWSQHPDGGDLRIVAVNDVTELKQVQGDLEHANRSKDRFVASVSHELRTPLAAVLGFAAELAESGDEFGTDERVDILEVIRSEAQEASNIIEDLLVAARADMGDVTVAHDEVDLVSSARSVIRSSGLDVEIVAESDEIIVCGDAGRIRQVLRNLVSNAGRYGGPNLRVFVRRLANRGAVEVADDGGSLTEADLRRIFEPYTRAHSTMGRTESVGLGLTVSKALAELMNGSLSARIESGSTVFRLELPTSEDCISPADPRPAEASLG